MNQAQFIIQLKNLSTSSKWEPFLDNEKIRFKLKPRFAKNLPKGSLNSFCPITALAYQKFKFYINHNSNITPAVLNLNLSDYNASRIMSAADYYNFNTTLRNKLLKASQLS